MAILIMVVIENDQPKSHIFGEHFLIVGYSSYS